MVGPQGLVRHQSAGDAVRAGDLFRDVSSASGPCRYSDFVKRLELIQPRHPLPVPRPHATRSAHHHRGYRPAIAGSSWAAGRFRALISRTCWMPCAKTARGWWLSTSLSASRTKPRCRCRIFPADLASEQKKERRSKRRGQSDHRKKRKAVQLRPTIRGCHPTLWQRGAGKLFPVHQDGLAGVSSQSLDEYAEPDCFFPFPQVRPLPPAPGEPGRR